MPPLCGSRSLTLPFFYHNVTANAAKKTNYQQNQKGA